MSRRQRVITAIETAIEGQKWLKYKWQGEYGNGYPASTKDFRIRQIDDLHSDLLNLKNEIKGGARI